MSKNLVLYKKIKEDVIEWKQNNYKNKFYEIKEILEFQFLDKEKNLLKFLRRPQFEALEVYLFLRFEKNNKKIIELYKEYFNNSDTDLLKSLGVNLKEEGVIEILVNGSIDNLFDTIKNDDDFVKKYKLENIRETISLDYTSFIFSLVMGAGKTMLIWQHNFY